MAASLDGKCARTTQRAAAWPGVAHVSLADLLTADTTEAVWRRSHHLRFRLRGGDCGARSLVTGGVRQLEFADHASFQAALRDAVDGASDGGGLVRDEISALAAKLSEVLPPRVGTIDKTKLARHLLSDGRIGKQALQDSTTRALFRAKRIEQADLDAEDGLAKELRLQVGDYVCGELERAICARRPQLFPWSSPDNGHLLLPVGLQFILPVHLCIDEGLARMLVSYVFDIEA